jgi:hypothetical protein
MSNDRPVRARHLVVDPTANVRRLVLREDGVEDVELTIQGHAPDRLRFRGRFWVPDSPAIQGTPQDLHYVYRRETDGGTPPVGG